MGYDKDFRNKYVKGGMLVVGNTTFQGNVNIEGSQSFENTLVASSDMTVAGTFKVQGNSSFNGTLKADNLLTATSGITVGKTLTMSSGSVVPVQTVSSTATTINAYGVSLLSSTKPGVRSFNLARPFTGRRKDIIALIQSGSSSSFKIRVASTATITITSTGGTGIKSFSLPSGGEGVSLLGASTVKWVVVSHTPAASIAGTSTTT